MTVDAAATFPLDGTPALGRGAALNLAADRQGFGEAAALWVARRIRDATTETQS
jgi:hypothetical protein